MSTYTDEQAISEFNDNNAQMINDTPKTYAIILGADVNAAIENSSTVTAQTLTLP